MSRYGKYSYSYRRRRRRSDNTAVLRALTIILPLLIVAVIAAGVFAGYREFVKDNPKPVYNQAEEETPALYTDEQETRLLMVVNESNPLTADFVPELKEVSGISVSALAAQPLEEMLSAAQKAGLAIELKQGYVSYSQQEKLNRDEQNRLQEEMQFTSVRAEAQAKKTVAPAGMSESQTGLLIKLACRNGEDFYKSDEFSWLERHCNEYGFVVRFPYDEDSDEETVNQSDLFRFVGVQNAMKLRSFGMTLDEYSVYLYQK